jgi:uncharacterized membrane protein
MQQFYSGASAMGPRQAFLQKLRLELHDLPGAVIDDIVGDLDRHFSDALAAGRSERQAALRLGDPVWLASEFRAATVGAAA